MLLDIHTILKFVFVVQYARIIQKLGFPAKFKVLSSSPIPFFFNIRETKIFTGLCKDSCLSSNRFSFMVQDFKIQNIVGSCDVKFPIRLEGLAYSHGAFSSVSATYSFCFICSLFSY